MPSNVNPVRPFIQPPMVSDPNLRLWLNWAHQAITQLQSQANPAPASGGVLSLAPNTIDPSTAQILSKGSRTSSVTTSIIVVTTPTTLTLYWDGTNGSVPLTIYRDDGTKVGPTIVGSPQVITGLTASTSYFLYPYWSDVNQRVQFAVGGTAGVGTPSYAFTAPNLPAAQQTLLAGNIPLALILATTGVATPATGTTTFKGGSGGGASGVGTCFSGNTGVWVGGPGWRSNTYFSDLRPGQCVLTAKDTWRMVTQVTATWYEGPMLDLGHAELVKPSHRFLVDGEWIEASRLGYPARSFKGVVFNCSIDSEIYDEQSFTLANGMVAHNIKNI